MSFIADKQTLSDLNLLGRHRPGSIFCLFNQVVTSGGERLLQEMFHQPLCEADAINKRSCLLRYFQELNIEFPFDSTIFSQAESYLAMGNAGSLPNVLTNLLLKKIKGYVLHDDQYQLIHQGMNAAIAVLNGLRIFLDQLHQLAEIHAVQMPYAATAQEIITILSHPELSKLSGHSNALSFMQMVKYDHLLRHTLGLQMETVLKRVYELDVYIAVSKAARSKGMAYATAFSKDQNLLQIQALHHPGITNGISNSLILHKNRNMLFLTGANMAGKSTLMKAFGIAVYLAHMGFPVAAADMQFSVMDGLYSSINVPDNLNMGYSHFYAEVLRVKQIAADVSAGKNLVILFDELFKGTNVKDAYDATLAVTESFSAYYNCFYIISTHIIEVGVALKTGTPSIQFAFLPTVMDGKVPQYTYQLEKGITTDRQGMLIIENEGVLDILAQGTM